MRRYVLVFFLLVVAVVSGCQPREDTTTREGPYVGGNDGLNIAFLEDAPGLSGNFQGDPIPLEVELVNNGEQEVAANSAKVNLFGAVMSNSFTRTNNDGSAANANLISKIRDSTDIPDSDFVNLGTATLKDSEPIGPSWSPNINVQVCYPYATYVQVEDLCIPGDRRETGVVECEIDNSKNLITKGDVSGAPVKVTSLVESRTGTGVRVTLDIENQGGGSVVSTCEGDPLNTPLENQDSVTVTVPSGYSCIFDGGNSGATGVVKLRNNKGRLRCTSNIGGTGSSYLDKFTATLTYSYKEKVTKTILIQSKTLNL